MSLHQPILKHPAIPFWTALLIQLLTYTQRLPRLDIDICRRVRLFDGYVIELIALGFAMPWVSVACRFLLPRFVQTAERSLPPSGFHGRWIISTREDWSRNHETGPVISIFEWKKDNLTYSGSGGSSRIQWRPNQTRSARPLSTTQSLRNTASGAVFSIYHSG